MVCGRFCVKQCGPSRRHVRNASAVLENFAPHQKRLFQHYLPEPTLASAGLEQTRPGKPFRHPALYSVRSDSMRADHKETRTLRQTRYSAQAFTAVEHIAS